MRKKVFLFIIYLLLFCGCTRSIPTPQERINSTINLAKLGLLQEKYTIKDFRLFGYSGGGAIAALLASHRKDIHSLVTIAGNLDTEYWTNKHKITSLHGSLNPADYTSSLEAIKQYHFIGEDDNIMDVSIYKSYASKFKNKDNLKYKIIKNNTHSKAWEKSWKQLLKEID